MTQILVRSGRRAGASGRASFVALAAVLAVAGCSSDPPEPTTAPAPSEVDAGSGSGGGRATGGAGGVGAAGRGGAGVSAGAAGSGGASGSGGAGGGGGARDASAAPSASDAGASRADGGGTDVRMAETPGRCTAYGLAGGLFVDGQAPGATLSEAQARTRLKILQPLSSWIRLYTSLGGHSEAACIAKKELGMKVALGAFINRDAAANTREMNALVAAAKQGCVDLAIVGSEALLRKDVTAAALVELMKQVKAQLPAGVQVATADTYTELTPAIIAASDAVVAHIYPFWEFAPVTYGVSQIEDRYKSVKAKAGNKPVIIGETGWPSAGRADATLASAADYFTAFVGWAKANDVPYFYFAAFDEKWKIDEMGVGQHWGIHVSDGKLKSGFDRAFRCEFPKEDPDAGKQLVGGEGKAAIELTKIPPLGSMALLEGRVAHVRPIEHRVAVYIQVAGGWWTKPTVEAAATRILPDGTWQAAVATGGNDAQARAIRAYLLPANVTPPQGMGQATLPATLATYPMAEATR